MLFPFNSFNCIHVNMRIIQEPNYPARAWNQYRLIGLVCRFTWKRLIYVFIHIPSFACIITVLLYLMSASIRRRSIPILGESVKIDVNEIRARFQHEIAKRLNAENRCRPQSRIFCALWTRVLIRITENPVFDAVPLLMKQSKSPSESKSAFLCSYEIMRKTAFWPGSPESKQGVPLWVSWRDRQLENPYGSLYNMRSWLSVRCMMPACSRHANRCVRNHWIWIMSDQWRRRHYFQIRLSSIPAFQYENHAIPRVFSHPLLHSCSHNARINCIRCRQCPQSSALSPVSHLNASMTAWTHENI